MNKICRIKMVKAMEYIARQINDEDVFMLWRMVGVADGDIEYGDLEANKADADMDYYIEDDNFAELMATFLRAMKRAEKSGWLYCDKVVSKYEDGGRKMWEAVAEYADGSTVRRLFEYNERRSEAEQQYEIECWLIEREKECVWYSVNYID